MGLIRTFLAIIVIIGHTQAFYGCYFLGGKIAVQSFYIISGFYMSLILNEKYININNSYKLFITNRLIRLYPIYWTVLLSIIISCILFGVFTDGNSYGALNVFKDNYNTLNPFSLFTVLFSNIFIFFQDALLFFELNLKNGQFFFKPFFDKQALNGFNFALIPQAWTIALELLFYIIAPFIVKRKTIVILFLFTFFIGFKYVLKHQLGLNHTPWNFRFFPNELPFFLLGVFSYKIYKSVDKKLIPPIINSSALILLIFFVIFFEKITFNLKNQLYFLLFFLSIPFIFKLTKKSKIDRYIGDLSYPLYITHIFIITIINKLNYVFITKGITVIIFSIIVSIILKHLVSDKIENYRQNRLKTSQKLSTKTSLISSSTG